MARLLGPDMGSRLVYLSSGAPAAGEAATVYADADGASLADIAAYDPDDPATPGDPISGSQVAADANGLLPLFWFPDGQRRLWVTVDGGPLTPVDPDNNARVSAVEAAIPVTVAAYGAVGDGTTDDAAAVQAALDDAAPGAVVTLPPGRYALGDPLTIPPGVELRGVRGARTDAQTASVLCPTASFSGTAVIRMIDKEQGSYGTENEGVRVTLVTIDGSDAPGSVAGISASGRVHGVVLDRVAILNMTWHGLTMSSYTRADTSVVHPYSWNMWNCYVSDCTADGVRLISATDCTLTNVQAIGCDGNGFTINSAMNSHLDNCRAEWCDGVGYSITGNWLTGQGAGGLLMTGCSTDRNSQHGILVDSTGSGQILLTGAMLRRDGRNGYPGSGGGSYAALRVSSATTPVVVNGITVYPGLGDDGLGTNSPQYAVSAASSAAVVVESGYLHAATTVWNDGGSNTVLYRGLGVVGATGTGGSPTRETSTHLDVTGRALGIVTPRDHELVAVNFDPALVSSGKQVVNGTLYLMTLYVSRAVPVTTIRWGVHTAGASPLSGQNLVALMNSSGVLLASTNVDADVTVVGPKATTITTQGLTPGAYPVALLFNAATPPTLYRGPGDLSATLLNLGISAAARYRFATNGTGRTSMPSSITMSSNVASQFGLFVAIA